MVAKRDRAETRARRTFRAGGETVLAVEAWRAGTGHGLVYFVPLAGGEAEEAEEVGEDGERPVDDDRGDRRALLESDESLEELPEDRLSELWGDAVPLTDTERRFRDPEGRLWLVQGVGPVWAGEEVASGATGLLFTSLEGPPRRVSAPGVEARDLAGADLETILEAAVASERERRGEEHGSGSRDTEGGTGGTGSS